MPEIDLPEAPEEAPLDWVEAYQRLRYQFAQEYQLCLRRIRKHWDAAEPWWRTELIAHRDAAIRDLRHCSAVLARWRTLPGAGST